MISERAFRLKKNGSPYFDCLCKTPELIENYEKAITDKTQVWECHHRAEICYSIAELIERGDYYNVPACNLIFLTSAEHNKLHKTENKFCVGRKLSDETRRKQSKSQKGKHWKLVDGKRVWY